MKSKLISVALSVVLALGSLAVPVAAQVPSDESSIQQMASLIQSLQSIIDELKAKLSALNGGAGIQAVEAQVPPPPPPDALPGIIWRLEIPDWTAIWTRRSGTNIFDASYQDINGRLITGALTPDISGSTITVPLTTFSDGNSCSYSGTLSSDMKTITGAYTCKYGGTRAWKVYIEGTPSTQATFTISSGVNDAYEGSGFTASGLQTWFGLWGGIHERTGLRFTNVTIPKGSTITSAVLRVVAGSEDDSNTVKGIIRGVAMDTAPAWSATYKPSQARQTIAGVRWEAVPWSPNVVHNSPDIRSIVQEIVNYPNWVSGNALSLLILNSETTGNADRAFKTFEAGSPAKLVVTYSSTSDITPPTAPTNLVAEFYLVPKLTLAWNSSTDNVGVAGYRIERCQGSTCTNFVQIGTAPATSQFGFYEDASAVSGIAYRWRVRANDAAGNLSGYSNIATETPNLLPGAISGGWSVEPAPSQPVEKWVPAGATGVTVNVLRFRATTEDFALAKIRLQLKAPASAADISSISLWDGTTMLTSKVPSFIGGVEDFIFPMSGSGSFLIPKNSAKDMTIKVNVARIGADFPGTAGKMVVVDFDGDASASVQSLAVGLSSAKQLPSSTNIDTQSSGIRYFRSVPTVAYSTIPQTTLNSGNLVLYKFKVAADPAYDIALNKFSFRIVTTGITPFVNAPASFVLWDTTDNKRVSSAVGTTATYYSDPSNKASDGSLIVRIRANTTDYASPWVTVSAGQTHTFELRGNITTDGIADSVTTTLLGDSYNFIDPYGKVYMNSAFAFDVSYSANFIWSDFSVEALSRIQSLYEPDWMNSFRLPGLPTTGLSSATLSN